MRALSPQKTLDRGYAVVQLETREIVRDPAQAPDGTHLKIRVAAGGFTATSNAPAAPETHQEAADKDQA